MSEIKPTGAHAVDANRDPISGEPGAHPVGTGLGAAAGGAMTGAAAGAAAGPVGTVVGTVVGAVAGGLAGKSVAESIDPTVEDAYWREAYPSRSYYDSALSYDDVRPAYQHGWETRGTYGGRTFEEAESELQRDWEARRPQDSFGWDRARHPARDAWERIDSTIARRREVD